MNGWWAGFGIGVGCWLGFNAAIVGACLLRGPRDPAPGPDRLGVWDPWDHPALLAAEKECL